MKRPAYTHRDATHPLVRELAADLGVTVSHAVGILECLWRWTLAYAPAGNVGKWTNADIARGVDWRGDPDGLIDGLLTNGWLIAVAAERLVVNRAQYQPPRRRIPRKVRAYVLARDEHRCRACGRSDGLQMDHVHPYSLGGSDEVANLQVLCAACNIQKGAAIQ